MKANSTGKGAGKDKKPESTALNYLSHRDRSSFEIMNYLEKKDFGEEEIQECLKNLEDWGLVDDEKFCRKFIRYSKDQARGSVRIRKELKEKGINRETIDLCIGEELSREEEIEMALAIAEKILDEIENNEISDRVLARIARRLASRGFPGNVIYTVVNKVKSP